MHVRINQSLGSFMYLDGAPAQPHLLGGLNRSTVGPASTFWPDRRVLLVSSIRPCLKWKLS